MAFAEMHLIAVDASFDDARETAIFSFLIYIIRPLVSTN